MTSADPRSLNEMMTGREQQMALLVGVDSGGTHTNIQVLQLDGTKKTVAEIDRSLSSNRSDAELREACDAIFSAIQVHTAGEPACAWINAAGYSAASRHRLERPVSAAIRHLTVRVGMSNDGVALLLAHDPELVAVIAGTGSVAMARNSAGEVITRGGDEWVVADYGSAFWLGLNGIRAGYRAVEGGPDTALLNCLLRHFSPLQDDERDTRVVVREIARKLASLGTYTKPTIAAFAPQVTREAELGDDQAQIIVRRAVDDLAAAAARVYRELAAQVEGRTVTPRFLLVGSVGYRSRFYFEAFRASLGQFLFDVRESVGRSIELECQLNGLPEALTLAQRLAEDKTIPALGSQHPFSIQSSPGYAPG
jgi:N-acetylglucosamine kinase-like BadF-type ATPase